MKNGHLADFFFTGLGIVPMLLTFGGHLDIAIMVFCPLLIAAILAGMYEQAAEDVAGEQDHDPADAGHGSASPRAATLIARVRRRTPNA